jgi:hypothetical protein
MNEYAPSSDLSSDADSVRGRRPLSCPGDAEAQGPAARAARSRLQLALHVQRTAGLLHVARSAPGRDTRSGQGDLARRHTDGPLWAALL